MFSAKTLYTRPECQFFRADKIEHETKLKFVNNEKKTEQNIKNKQWVGTLLMLDITLKWVKFILTHKYINMLCEYRFGRLK